MRIRTSYLRYNQGTTQTGPSGAGNAISTPDPVSVCTTEWAMPQFNASPGIVVPLTRGKFALIDEDDAQRVLAFKWHYNGGYAMRARRASEPPLPRSISMHRWVLEAPMGEMVDHINGDPLDNRKSNLRYTNPTLNQANANRVTGEKYRGVYWSKQSRKWHAALKAYGRQVHLGFFDDPVEAARVWDAAAAKAYGDSALLNFPDDVATARREKPLEQLIESGSARVAVTVPMPADPYLLGRWIAENYDEQAVRVIADALGVL